MAEINIKTQDGRTLTIFAKDGKDGINGKTPIAGVDFPLPRDGVDGKDGLVGERGDTGERGEKGIQGIDGKDGKQGLRGQRGEKGDSGSPDTAQEVKDKLLSVGIDYEDIKNTPDIQKIVQIYSKQSSKTVSLAELDDVNLSGVTQTNGKYDLGSGGGHWDKPFGDAVFTYDVDGNVDTKTVGTTVLNYTYDIDGNVESVTDGTNIKTFTYDVDGNVDTIVYT